MRRDWVYYIDFAVVMEDGGVRKGEQCQREPLEETVRNKHVKSRNGGSQPLMETLTSASVIPLFFVFGRFISFLGHTHWKANAKNCGVSL